MNAPRTNLGANLKLNTAPAPSANVRLGSNSGLGSASMSRSMSEASEGVGGFLLGWGGVLLILVLLVVLFAVYYQTIGYYIQLGWSKLAWSHNRGEKIEIVVPGTEVVAQLQPAGQAGGPASSSISASLGGAVNRLESDVEAALGVGAGQTQVFNVARNVYTYADAEPLCKAFGAELATYDQVKDAYNAGGDWCNYGWVKGQLAVYPTQQSTYDKLQAGPAEKRQSCGIPGVNGGYFPNAEQRFGVNCYGARPSESQLDARIAFEAAHETEFDRKVDDYKAELGSIAVNPWSTQQWSA
jgi:hypothetical protein